MKYQFTIDMPDPSTSHGKILSHIIPNSTILECGCASGYMTRYLHHALNCTVSIVEKDAEGFETARQYSKDGICADLMENRWYEYFQGQQFDYIIFSDVLEHLTEPETVIKKAVTLLREDGKMLISLPNICHNDIIIKMLNNHWDYTSLGLLDDTHVHFWGMENLEALLHNSGLSMVVKDGTLCPTGQTEQAGSHGDFVDEPILNCLKIRYIGEIYQFVLCAQKTAYVQKHGIQLENRIAHLESTIKGVSLHQMKEERNRLLLQCSDYEKQLNEYRENAKDEYIKKVDELQRHCNIYAQKMDNYSSQHAAYMSKLDAYEEKLDKKLESQKSEIERLQEKNSLLEKALEEAEEHQLEDRMRINNLDAACKAHEGVIEEKDARILRLEESSHELEQSINNYRSMCYDYTHSTSWKITSPLRFVSRHLQALNKGKKAELPAPAVANTVQSVEDSFWAEMIKKDNPALSMPLVSVVIPIYDRTDVLIESIESILHQTYPNVELIAVCDGSPEATLAIVRNYEQQGKLRAFYYKDNSGNAVRGRNKAIKEARGEFLAFQDSDDVATPERIALSVQYAQQYHADVVYGAWRAMVDGSRKIDIENGAVISSPDCDLEYLKKVCVPCQSTVMARISALRFVGGLKPAMKYREDHELWLRLAYYGYKFKAIDQVLTNLRLHGNNLELSMKKDDEHWVKCMMSEYKKIDSPKKKIGYVIPGCGLSGGIAVILQHANRLLNRGYDVVLITEDEQTQIDWFPNQRVKIVPVAEAPQNLDVIIATGWSTAYTVEKLSAVKKCYFVQSDETRFNPVGTEAYYQAKATYSMPYTYFTEARWIQSWLKDTFSQTAAYIPNGIDERIIYEVKGLRNPNGKVRVLLEGPIAIPYKGMEDAFKAVEGLDCEVWCVSSAGEPRPEWKCDKFLGKVNMNRMRYIYSSCDILLKMSQVEGFFGPPMEMMACGGTCIVGKVTGYDEYIVDGYNALVVEQGDVAGAHNALKKLIANKELRKKLIQGGYETARKWGWNSSIDLLEKLISKETRMYRDENEGYDQGVSR